MRADAYWLKIDDIHFLAHPGEIAHLEFPGNLDVHASFPIDALAHFSPEPTQQPGLEARRPREGGQKKHALDQIPKDKHPLGPAQIKANATLKKIVANASHSAGLNLAT